MSNVARFHSRCGRVLQLISSPQRLHRSEGEIYLETLESNAKSSAASPYTSFPLFSLSISKPPSYVPMSIPGCVAPFSGDGGAAVFLAPLAVPAVVITVVAVIVI